jgi:hypothetical protein
MMEDSEIQLGWFGEDGRDRKSCGKGSNSGSDVTFYNTVNFSSVQKHLEGM